MRTRAARTHTYTHKNASNKNGIGSRYATSWHRVEIKQIEMEWHEQKGTAQKGEGGG